MLFEYCCEPVSRLSNQVIKRGGQALRIGLPVYDVSRAKDVDAVIARGRRALKDGLELWIWASRPCSP
eukprot:10137257-Lingulodinium_polyedra.AAC.1